MKNVFVINAHEEYDFAKGELNRTLTQLALDHLKSGGYETRSTTMKDEWQVDAEIEKHCREK